MASHYRTLTADEQQRDWRTLSEAAKAAIRSHHDKGASPRWLAEQFRISLRGALIITGEIKE